MAPIDTLTASEPHIQPAAHSDDGAERSVWLALWRGFLEHCPSCGEGRIFASWLKISPECNHCRQELHHHRADDAPAYFTILIVGHLIIGPLLWMEVAYKPPYWLHLAIWPALTILMSLFLLPRIKGALVGLQWACRMHGFNPHADDEDALARAPEHS